MTAPSFAARAMTEAQLQASVEELAAWLGWWTWHDVDSRRNRAGLPDLLLVRGDRALWRELKKETGRVRPEQARVLDMLTRAGQDAAIWRPADWTSGLIRKELS